MTVIINDPIPEDLQNLSEAEIEEVIANSKLADLRHVRNMLLAETDWTQNPDVPQETKDRWAAYRQQLRDMTITYQDLNGAVWPDKPE